MPRVPVDSRTPGFEGDSDERIEHATCPAMAESGANPEDHISDWRDFEGDYTQAELDAADGRDGAADRHERVLDSYNSADNDITPLV